MIKSKTIGGGLQGLCNGRFWFVAAVCLFVMVAGLMQSGSTWAASAQHRLHRTAVDPRDGHSAGGMEARTKKSPRPAVYRSSARAVRLSKADSTEQVSVSVVHALRAAQRATGIDPYLLLAIAWKESSFDSKARNRHSSARGLLQFTTTTWLTVVRDFGAQNGLARYAAAISTDREGRLSVSKPRLRRAILALRDDPYLQAILTVERLQQERKSLEDLLGHPAQAADLYFLHLLGPTGARRFLTQLAEAPNTSSVEAVGSVAISNEGMFIKEGRPVTVAEAYAGVQATLDEQAARYANLFDHPTVILADTK